MLKTVNKLAVACINSWVWVPLMQENVLWMVPCIIMGVAILSLMNFQDYEDDVMTFILMVTLPLIVGLTFSESVQAFIAQWGFLGALLVVFFDGLLFVILAVLLYLALDYEDFIPFRKD